MSRRRAAGALAGLGLLARLPAFLRDPIDPPSARRTLAARLAHRDENFLALVRETVYRRADGPYRRLLAWAGCEHGDLVRLVREGGVEGALRALCRQGVFLTLEEFKGRRPVVRGALTFTTGPADLAGLGRGAGIVAQTSGSRNAPTRATYTLEFARDLAVDTGLALDAMGGYGWVRAHWEVPGGATMVKVLQLAKAGARPDRWFSPVGATVAGLGARYRWGPRLVSWVSRAAGCPIPYPEPASLEDPAPVLDWMHGVLRAGKVPHLFTYASPAVRLVQAAGTARISLRGSRVWIGGEPLTPTRRALLEDAGMTVYSRYATAECGILAQGCLRPEGSDDLHVCDDLVALIDGSRAAGPYVHPDRSLLVTTLRPSAPLVLLNVSLGDRAVMTPRVCGCALEALGWRTHLREVRSHEKLTAHGLTFLDADVTRILEAVLPARFGGAPTDYQLVADDAGDGRARMRLLVHPRVGSLDPDLVRSVFIDAVGAGGDAQRMMATVLGQSGAVVVERATPLGTATGKIHHVHAAPGPAPPFRPPPPT